MAQSQLPDSLGYVGDEGHPTIVGFF
jgi:hypothetical protein